MLGVIIAVIFAGCGYINHASFADNVDVNGWRQAATIEINNLDTTKHRNLTLFILYESGKIAGRLPLNIVTQSPSGVQIAEQIDVWLDHERGSETALNRTIQHFIYRDNVRWRELGRYKIFIYPRAELIEGVVAAGVRIDRSSL